MKLSDSFRVGDDDPFRHFMSAIEVLISTSQFCISGDAR
jgi:hypothetical protein